MLKGISSSRVKRIPPRNLDLDKIMKNVGGSK